MSDIQQILAERGSRYGRFDAHALVTQRLKQALTFGANWNSLEPDAKEALEMIVHKIGRILSGDPDYDDSWVDICGYSQLIVDRIRRTGEYASPELAPGTVVEVPAYPELVSIAPWHNPEYYAKTTDGY
jgi:hypothetical protein